MSYRTYVKTTGKDSIQILGNNESYEPLFDELKKQGIKIDSDGCFFGNDIKTIVTKEQFSQMEYRIGE